MLRFESNTIHYIGNRCNFVVHKTNYDVMVLCVSFGSGYQCNGRIKQHNGDMVMTLHKHYASVIDYKRKEDTQRDLYVSMCHICLYVQRETQSITIKQ